MSALLTAPAIAAIAYPAGAAIDDRLHGIVGALRARGIRLAGFVQRARHRPDRLRCDMLLEELSTGDLVDVTQDRGPHASGCRLDVAALLHAMIGARDAIATCDLLVINRFGKTEADGGGFRALIVEAVEQGVPVLTAVPCRNLDAWRSFAGDAVHEVDFASLDPDPVRACVQLSLLPQRAFRGPHAPPKASRRGGASPASPVEK